MDEGLIIGVDCGGTRTRAALADRTGRVLGVGEAGGGNPRDGGAGRTLEAVGLAVGSAFAAAGQSRRPTAWAALGIAGVASDTERASVRSALAPLSLAPPDRIEITHDMRVALAGAFVGKPGIVLIAGTGSCCYGCGTDGREWRAGGWGGRLDDGGGATGLGVDAIRAVIHAGDGRGPPTVLSDLVLNALGVSDLRGVLGVVESSGYRSEVAKLAPLVVAAAGEGDAAAVGIVGGAAEALVGMLVAVARGIGWLEEMGPVPVSLLGGVLESGGVVADELCRRLNGSDAPLGSGAWEVRPARLPPVLGAVLIAAGRSTDLDEGFAQRLESWWEAR